jgi:hypothetical protein
MSSVIHTCATPPAVGKVDNLWIMPAKLRTAATSKGAGGSRRAPTEKRKKNGYEQAWAGESDVGCVFLERGNAVGNVTIVDVHGVNLLETVQR